MANMTTLLLVIVLSVGLVALGMWLRKPIRRATHSNAVAQMPLIAAVIVAALALAWAFGLFSVSGCDETADPTGCGAVALPSDT